MLLQRVNQVLRSHLGDGDKNLTGVLGQVLRLLNQSDGGYNRDRLKQALTYLGSLPVATAGMSTVSKKASLISMLEKSKRGEAFQGKFVFDRNHLEKMKDPKMKGLVFVPQAAFSGHAARLLAELYFEMLDVYQRQAWVYDYPLEVFKQWESEMARPGVKDEALRDFQRDVVLGGDMGGSEKEVRARVDRLVAEVDCPPEEQEKLATWLRNNGGQKSTSFLTEMLINNHFSESHVLPTVTQNTAGWLVEGGKLVYHVNCVLGVLQVGDRYLAARQDGSIVTRDEVPEETIVEQQHIKMKNAENRQQGKPEVSIPGVLQMKVSMSLEINERGEVQPRMSSCKVMSYTPVLLSPARLFDEPDKDFVMVSPGSK